MNRITEKINKKVIVAFTVLLAIVVIAQISSRIVDYNEETNELLDIALFSLIGIPYLGYSWVSKRKVLKLIFLTCGIYLIVMNFLSESIYEWIAIICVVTPLLIIMFLPEKEADKGEPVVD